MTTPADDLLPLAHAPLAYRDPKFVDSDEARPLRILAEYLQPFGTFQRERVRDTIVFFGSARLLADGPFAAYYDAARELARLVVGWANEIPGEGDRFLVCTGGGGGIMEAANRGAQEAGGRTIGLNIGLPFEQYPNAYITPELLFQFHYFFMRKLWFAHLAKALVVFPGGFGTLDELFEMLTLSQTGKLDRSMVILLYGSAYWNEIVDFPALARHGMVAPEDLRLIRFVDTPAQALAALKEGMAAVPEPATPAFAKSVTPEGPVTHAGAQTLSRGPGSPA
jgi:uncharacterized protein (TIGR00730 family)